MEKTVRLLQQGSLIERQWQNSQGENVTIKSLELKLTDGIDTFVAEATDTLAQRLNDYPLHSNLKYRAQLRLRVRTCRNADKSREWEQNEIRLQAIQEL